MATTILALDLVFFLLELFKGYWGVRIIGVAVVAAVIYGVKLVVRARYWLLRYALNLIFPSATEEECFLHTHLYSVRPLHRLFAYVIRLAPQRDDEPYPPSVNGCVTSHFVPAHPILSMVNCRAHGWWAPSGVRYILLIFLVGLIVCSLVWYRPTFLYETTIYSSTQVVSNCPFVEVLHESCVRGVSKRELLDYNGEPCTTARIEAGVSVGCILLQQQRNEQVFRQCHLTNHTTYSSLDESCFRSTAWTDIPEWLVNLISLPALFYFLLYEAPLYYNRKIKYPITLSPGLATRLRDINIPQLKVPHGARHTHPLAAASRNAADRAIMGFILDNGYEPYCVQMSPKDIAGGHQGSLRHIWPGTDGHSSARSDPLHPFHYLKFLNVDYYVDWVEYLWTSNPVIMFTFTPNVPCGTYQETSWTANLDSSITMEIAGGATYTHKLWNYNVDSFEAVYPGITIHYAVERVAVNDHWSIVTMTPKSYMKNVSKTSYTTLQRIQFVQRVIAIDGVERDVAMLRDHTGRLSLSLPGQFKSITLSVDLQTMLKSRSRKPIAFSDLVVILQADYGQDVRLAQAIVYECFPSTCAEASVITDLQAKNIAVSYRRVGTPTLEAVEKTSATVLCPPVLDSGYAPMKCKSNDAWCVKARITDVHNPQTILGGDQHAELFMSYAQEFIQLLVPIPHLHAPKEITEVVASQNRPTQRRNNLRAQPMLAAFLANEEMEVKSFQKGEVYSGPKDPRNISTLPPEHCLVYSTYMQVVAQILKKTHWYAFGLHPDEVAERIHRMAAHALTITETDFSRFDGTHSMAFYEHLELALLLRIFHPSQHNLIITVHRMMCQAKARTSWGVKYDPAGSRLSGAADTSAGNSIDNAYVNFCTFRRMGCTPIVAWKRLGFYGGDDGATADIDGPTLEWVVKALGFSLKAKARKPWEYLNFLGRVYTCPSAGPQHCADLPRQLSKLHMHPATRVAEPEVALYNKALGHHVTDATTPILGAWAAMIFRTCPNVVDTRYQSYSYSVNPNSIGTRYVPSRHAMMRYASLALDMTEQQILQYEDHLYQLTSPQGIVPIAERVVQLPTVGVILGEDLVVASSSNSSVPVSTHVSLACIDGSCTHARCHPVASIRSYQRIDAQWNRGAETKEIKGESKRTAPVAPVKYCAAFAAGKCQRTSCKYVHAIPPRSVHPCKDFEAGRCKRANCKFSHIPVRPSVVAIPPPVNATPPLTSHDSPLAV